MNYRNTFFGLLLFSSLSQATVITQWTFESVSTPLIGTGTATAIGGTTAGYNTGNPLNIGDPAGSGWNTTTYPAQAANSGTAGVQFAASTNGYSNIAISFDHRASGGASRFASIEYTVDGSNWAALGTNAGSLTPDTFSSFSYDLSAITSVNNNANFAFRVVSIFSPVAFDQNTSLSDYAASSAYMRSNSGATFTLGGGTGAGDYNVSGSWRFDNVTVRSIPEPSAALLGALGLLAFQRRRR